MSGNASHLREINSRRTGDRTMGCMNRLIATAAMMFLTAGAAAQVADPVRLRKAIDGYRVELVVEAILDPAISAQHSAGYQHRIRLSVREPKIGHLVQLGSATLQVAERGHPGQRYQLEAVQSPEGPAYEAMVRMAVKGTYRMVVHATPQGTSRGLTARFEYRHHH